MRRTHVPSHDQRVLLVWQDQELPSSGDAVMSEEKEQSVVNPAERIPEPNVVLRQVLQIIDDWEQDYFVPISLAPHTKAHMDNAIAQLKERVKGLSL